MAYKEFMKMLEELSVFTLLEKQDAKVNILIVGCVMIWHGRFRSEL